MTKFPALEQAQGELNTKRAELKSLMDEAGPDMNLANIKSISGDKLAHIRELNAEITKRKEKVDELIELSGIAEANAKEFFESGDGAVPNFKRDDGGTKTLGEAFVTSAAFKNKHTMVALDDVNVKTLMTRAAGWDPEEVRSGKLVLEALRPAQHVVNFVPSTTVSQAAYKYMEETTFATNEAGGSNVAGETAEGGTFVEAQLALTERSKTVEKITVWLPITDEQLEDEPSAQAYVNQRLTAMMQMRLDMQILRGDGNTPNLLGTENVVGISTQAKGTDSIMDAAYKLFTTIRKVAFSEPSVVFLDPSKWQEVVLTKTADGQYLWNHPSTTGPATLWGVPVVQTTVPTSTKLVTGDYATHALLGIRRGITMQTTNAHSDFFINGKQAIRADMRAVMVHFRPEAFGTVTGL